MVISRLTLLLFTAALLTSCGLDEEMVIEGETVFDKEAYVESRKEKDEAFSDIDLSPLQDHDIPSFSGLNYYEPSAEFLVQAKMVRIENPDTIQLSTTKDDLRDAIRYGTLKFNVRGKSLSLTAFQFLNSRTPYLFAPFKDETTGKETYPTGRYLDLEVLEEGEYTLDFNNAYNPLCAYNHKYSCPLVPDENRLLVSIEAGEKDWHK